MRRVAILEIWIDDSLEDSEQCARTVICEASDHYYCSDGTVEVRVLSEDL